MIQPRFQKGRVKLGNWSPGLKRCVSEGCSTSLHGDMVAPSPLVIHNTMATNSKAASLDDITWDDEVTAPSIQFSVRTLFMGTLMIIDNSPISCKMC